MINIMPLKLTQSGLVEEEPRKHIYSTTPKEIMRGDK